MDIRNTVSHPHLPIATPQIAGTLAETQRGESATRVLAADATEVATQVTAIADYLKEHIFKPHRQSELPPPPPNSSSAERHKIGEHNEIAKRNNGQLDAIADSRAKILQREGQTPADIADTLAKAAKLDLIAAYASSALRATPFAAAGVLQYVKPEINEGNWLPPSLKPLSPLISGTLSGMIDEVGRGLTKRATSDTQFLKVDPEQLHGAMAASLDRNAPSLLQKTVDAGIAIQTYSARNLVRSAVATGLTHKPDTRALVDNSISAAGGIIANIGFAHRMQTTENRDHQRGGAFVFGRKDAEAKSLDDETEWLSAYKELQNASYSGAAFNAAKRLAGLPLDALTDSGKAVQGLFSATGLTRTALALGGGFAAVGKLQAIATKNVSNPTLNTAVGQLANVVGSAVVFPTLTTASILTDPATRAAEDLLQKGLKNAAAKASSFVTNKIAQGAKTTGELVTSTAEALITTGITTGAQLRASLLSAQRRTAADSELVSMEEGHNSTP